MQRLRLWLAIGGVAACTLVACAAVNPYYDPAKHHHTPTGFRNNDIGTVGKSLGDLLRWFSTPRGKPATAPQPTPVVAADTAFLHANAQAGTAMAPAATWIGHATLLVQAGGLNVLTDPIFSERASPVGFVGPRRLQPPGIAIDQLPHIDVVVVSHNHFDHLDRHSVLLLAAQAGGSPLFLVPLGVKPWFGQLGIDRVVELDWWQSHTVAGTEFFLTPVQHWSGRSLTDRHHALWGGWAVFAPAFQWYFSGDTGYSQDFVRTRQHFADRQRDGGFDLALIAIGAYEPNWFMKDQHVNPREAVRIHQDIGSRHSIGMHWGTFDLSDETTDQPPADLARERQALGVADSAFEVLAIGQTRQLPRRSAKP